MNSFARWSWGAAREGDLDQNNIQLEHPSLSMKDNAEIPSYDDANCYYIWYAPAIHNTQRGAFFGNMAWRVGIKV